MSEHHIYYHGVNREPETPWWAGLVVVFLMFIAFTAFGDKKEFVPAEPLPVTPGVTVNSYTTGLLDYSLHYDGSASFNYYDGDYIRCKNVIDDGGLSNYGDSSNSRNELHEDATITVTGIMTGLNTKFYNCVLTVNH